MSHSPITDDAAKLLFESKGPDEDSTEARTLKDRAGISYRQLLVAMFAGLWDTIDRCLQLVPVLSPPRSNGSDLCQSREDVVGKSTTDTDGNDSVYVTGNGIEHTESRVFDGGSTRW